MARPISEKSMTALLLIDAQVSTEWALRALRIGEKEEARRCMMVARYSQQQAAGVVEGLKREEA